MAYTNQANEEITPQGYEIESLEIIGDFGRIDVSYMLMELNITETLDQANCITGSLALQDGVNIISNLPVMEGDRIKGFFTRNPRDPYVREFDPDYELKFEYEIVKITSQEKIKQDVIVWSVSFVSSTWTDNLASRVSKSYRKLPYSDMIIDIYDTWLSRKGLSGELPIKPLEVEKTEKLWNIVIPNWKAYSAIEFLSRKAFLGDFVKFVFYEDKEKFYFKPMNKIVAEGPKADYFTPAAETYIEDGEGKDTQEDALLPQYNRLLTFKQKGYHDLSLAAKAGMIGSRLIKHDIFNKMITDYRDIGPEGDNYIIDDPYNYFDQFGKLDHCEDSGVEMIKAKTNDKFFKGDQDGILNVYPEHKWQWDDQEQFEPDKWIRENKGQSEMYEFIRFEAITPGNFTRRVGDKINVKYYSPEWKEKGPREEPKIDLKFNGNYIITTLKRKFTGESYVNVLELMKDDYFSIENDPIWEEAEDPINYLKFDGHGKVRGL